MNKYSFTNNGKTWERITKKQALAAYNNGLPGKCPRRTRWER